MKHQLRQWYYRVCLFLGIYKMEDFVTVSDVVNEAYIDLYSSPCTNGLCLLLRDALYKHAGIYAYSTIVKYIPKFTKKFVGAPKRTRCGYWWPDLHGLEAREIRLEALTKLYNYYIDHDELILKGKDL